MCVFSKAKTSETLTLERISHFFSEYLIALISQLDIVTVTNPKAIIKIKHKNPNNGQKRYFAFLCPFFVNRGLYLETFEWLETTSLPFEFGSTFFGKRKPYWYRNEGKQR